MYALKYVCEVPPEDEHISVASRARTRASCPLSALRSDKNCII